MKIPDFYIPDPTPLVAIPNFSNLKFPFYDSQVASMGGSRRFFQSKTKTNSTDRKYS